jgi:peptide/nickel transport system permease protein
MSFWQYAVTRLALTVPMVFILLSVVFVVLRVMPGDVCIVVFGGRGRSEDIQRCQEQLGLNKPILAQYVDYVAGITRLDFGVSMRTNKPVLHEILNQVPATLELALAAMAIAVLIGLVTGWERRSPAIGRSITGCAS